VPCHPDTFNAATNPHDFTVGGVDFLGTSGQNVLDLCKYTDVAGSAKGEAGSDEAAPQEQLVRPGPFSSVE
jgi:DNA polymerase II small subunit/DNA polymerase delta subunit B